MILFDTSKQNLSNFIFRWLPFILLSCFISYEALMNKLQTSKQLLDPSDLCFLNMIYHGMMYNSFPDHHPFRISGLFLIFFAYRE